MSEYRLYAVRVFTTRWEETLSFYRDVVGFPVQYVSADIGWAQFSLGAASIGLERCAADDPEAAELVGRFVGVSIEVDDIASTFGRLSAAGVEFTGPPEHQPWGGSLAHFKDPDGNILTLLETSSQAG